MSDYLLELAKNATARKIVKTLGLPVPMPQELRRAEGARQARPLVGKNVALWTLGGVVSEALLAGLDGAGAQVLAAAEAGLEEVSELDPASERRLDGFVFDATELQTVEELRALYDFFHPLMGRVPECGRVVVVGRPPEQQKSAGSNAAQAALEGFTRSLAKEVARGGATANLLYVEEGAEGAILSPLRFFLSDRAAYVDGQSLRIFKPHGKSGALSGGWENALDGQVALVTGAAQGIGRECARVLAGEGAEVILADLSSEEARLSALAEELGGAIFLGDISAEDTPERLIALFREEYDGVDIVVHNAGITRDKTLKRMKPEAWDMTLDVNLGAIERVTRRLYEEKALNTDGRIICLSSIAGIAGNLGQTNYASSKAGVIGLVDHWSREFSRRRITANAVAPGFIETRMTAAMPAGIREAARRLNNLRQGGHPGDIAQAVAFLAMPQSQGLNGQLLRVCGGAMLGR